MKISGDDQRTCIHGDYTGDPPVCVITCGTPRDYSGATTGNQGVVAGSFTNYTCDTDPTIVTTATCQQDGRWLYDENFPCFEITHLVLPQSTATRYPEVTDGDINTYSSIGPSNVSSLIFTLYPYSYHVDIYQYIIRFTNQPEMQLVDVEFCLKSSYGGSTLENPCVETHIGGQTANLVINETLPCCYYGNTINITGYMNNAEGYLNISEVEVYGRIPVVDCGLPVFMYGADAVEEMSGVLPTVKYVCRDGFYTTFPFNWFRCNPNNEWDYYDQFYLICSAEPLLHLNITKDYDGTCFPIHDMKKVFDFNNDEPVEVISFTANMFGYWSSDDFTVSTILDGIETPCYRVFPEIYYFHTFVCNYQLATGLVIQKDEEHPYLALCDLKITGREMEDRNALECYRKEDAKDYRGRMNHTISGKPCDSWSETSLNVSINLHNYCRAFSQLKPWCWVDGYSSWEFCAIVRCETMCSQQKDGFDYVGDLKFTKNGNPCRHWETPDKYGHIFEELSFAMKNRNNSECRNPGRSQGRPWCYIDGSADDYEECSVPMCPEAFSRLEFPNCSDVQPITLQYMYYWDLDTNSTIEYYNYTISLVDAQFYCQSHSVSDVYGFTLSHVPYWVQISYICVVEELTANINMSYCQSSSSISTPEVSTTAALQSSTTLLETSKAYSDDAVIDASSTSLYSTPASLLTTSLYSTPASPLTTSLYSTLASPLTTSLYSTPASPITTSLYLILASPITTSLYSTPASPITTALYSTPASPITTSLYSTPSSPITTSLYSIPASPITTSLYLAPANNVTLTSKECSCRCFTHSISNISKEIMEDQLENITKALSVETSTLSATIRKLTSATDPRPSATYVGSAAIFIFSMTFVMIIIPDVINIIFFFKQKINQNK